ncbi:hypothetical protein L484_017807 [Morus notabilis]|uniref:Uncharacterized protein n=1 Tax=Morus notabilis TaxID=981085 RepID=W9QPZ6_9ROSA|nr:uncharacterized protein LOC21400791 [Morus notabilis]XP_024018619.1 uncharacterized protein LOC21400791 [Morus notabilis]EXB50270.1 hypothetical protein L484_017807 [Morus notabilis]
MVQSLEAIKGGGGSIRVGTTGTISSLMTRELESMKASSQKPSPSSSRNKPQAVPYVGASPSTPRRLLQPRKTSDEASSSSSRTSNHANPDFARKTKGYPKNTHRIPMLGSDNIALDRTPSREKTDKKGPINIVEVVDIKCGNSDNNNNRAWTSPITSRLRKLGFSKLSESIV